jgi:hypothetical protein
MLLIVKGFERLLVNSTVAGGLVVPTPCPVNHNEAAEIVACKTPPPDNETVCGLLNALSVTLRVPVSPPRMLGVNLTEIVHVLLAGTLLPQVLVWAKSPLVVMLIATGVNSSLTRFTTRGGLVVFSA